jgi:hypothetical protein
MQPTAPSAMLSSAPSAVVGAVSSGSSILDVTAVESQIVQMIEANPAYLAYKTFSDAANSLSQVIPDEKTRFQAASATTKLTYAEVKPSLDSWAAIVESEKQNFEGSYVAAAQADITAIDVQLQATEAELAELAKKLGEVSERKNALMQDKVQRESDLSKAKIDFDTVVKTVTHRFTTLAAKLTQFIGGANV